MTTLYPRQPSTNPPHLPTGAHEIRKKRPSRSFFVVCMIFEDSWCAAGAFDPDRLAPKPFGAPASWNSPPSRPDGALRAEPGYAGNASLGNRRRSRTERAAKDVTEGGTFQ
jgi:hypothetical protein